MLLMSDFLGEEGGKKASKATKSTKKVAKKAAEEETDEGGEGGDDADLPKVMLVKLKSAAKKADSHDDFIEAAMEIAGVADNDAALEAVTDEAQFDAWRES